MTVRSTRRTSIPFDSSSGSRGDPAGAWASGRTPQGLYAPATVPRNLAPPSDRRPASVSAFDDARSVQPNHSGVLWRDSYTWSTRGTAGRTRPQLGAARAAG